MKLLSNLTRAAGALGLATLLAVAPTAGAQVPVSAAYAPACGPSTSCTTLSFSIANPFATTLELNSLTLISSDPAFAFRENFAGSGVGTYDATDDLTGSYSSFSTVSGSSVFIDFTEGGQFSPFTLNAGGSGLVQVQLTGTPALQPGVFTYSAEGQNDVTFRGTVSVASTAVVPEPSTYLLMATGLGGIALAARRRRVQN